MTKRNNKHERRIKRFIVGTGLFTILLATSTYAWFIGMKTVSVSPFDVKIAAIDSLSLSLNGADWSDTLEINKANYDTASYEGNTNTWGGDGLIPMSSVGVIDNDSSRLILYQKGSLTATPGGYRLMASQVENNGEKEQEKGYVAFDLFIRNLSGEEYYENNNPKNEEGIYLTPDSVVTVGAAGEKNTGIENSVRVAFAQIGRVEATTEDVGTITGINCQGGGNVTPICNTLDEEEHTRTATIWEPNDKDHVANAINWYTTSCKKRKSEGTDLTLPESYVLNGEEACTAIENGTFYPTYAVGGEIKETDHVDVYDGTEYNGYTTSVSASPAKGKLYAFPTFTDTMKNKEGVERPEFMTLAPNSITKVRVYIYIEGQDVDNYDFASLGKQISVEFGLSKERFYGTDIDYQGTPTLPDDVIKEKHQEDKTPKTKVENTEETPSPVEP